MNNPHFIFLVRREHILALAAHVAASILVLVLLTGTARAASGPVSPPGTDSSSSVTAHR